MQDKKKKKKPQKNEKQIDTKNEKKKIYNKMCVWERERERAFLCGNWESYVWNVRCKDRFESLAHKVTGLRPKKPKIMNL